MPIGADAVAMRLTSGKALGLLSFTQLGGGREGGWGGGSGSKGEL